MRKQHGVVFQAPVCKEHNEEMSLHRFAVWQGQETKVSYAWACPHESVEESCEVRDYVKDVPQAVLDAYGDPSPEYSGDIDTTPVRLYPQSSLDYGLFGGGGRNSTHEAAS